MVSRARQLVAPLYLFLCLIIGGSAQGIWGNMVLQLLGLAIIAWAASRRSRGAVRRAGAAAAVDRHPGRSPWSQFS